MIGYTCACELTCMTLELAMHKLTGCAFIAVVFLVFYFEFLIIIHFKLF